jgi:glutathione S-transferase
MSEIILHQFAASPFSEKLRLVLGFKGLAYQSVKVPAIMPKPDVVALTGGYRRTPFLQMGSDVYCDTALICKVLEKLHPTPTLYPSVNSALSSIFAQWADSTLFWAAVSHNRGPKGAGSQFAAALTDPMAAVFADRKAMGFDITWFEPGDATPAYVNYLDRLTSMLHGQSYLFGAQPCIADFCAYHPIWMVHIRGKDSANLLQHYPDLKAWTDRMKGIGHSNWKEMSSDQAIDVAASCEPLPLGAGPLANNEFLNEHGIALGTKVSISAESFGKEPTAGELVAATADHFSLRRTDARAKTVHVHFPRIGYVLKRVVE